MEEFNRKFTFLNGHEQTSAEACFENSAFYWGQSIFTTGLIQKGQLSFFFNHEKRLKKSFQWLFGSKDVPSLEVILRPSILMLPVEVKKLESLKIRITLFENLKNELQSLVEFSPHKPLILENICCKTTASPVLSISRPGYVKIGSYGEVFRERKSMAQEPLFFDIDGNLLEGAIANIVLREKKSGDWVTPTSKFTIVNGLGLQEGLRSLSVRAVEIKVTDLKNYCAAYFINCLKGVTSISKIDGISFEANEAHIKELQDSYELSRRESGRVLWQTANE